MSPVNKELKVELYTYKPTFFQISVSILCA